jgi:hypothetical protein
MNIIDISNNNPFEIDISKYEYVYDDEDIDEIIFNPKKFFLDLEDETSSKIAFKEAMNSEARDVALELLANSIRNIPKEKEQEIQEEKRYPPAFSSYERKYNKQKQQFKTKSWTLRH